MEIISAHASSKDACWNLFKGIAFKEGRENVDLELVEIGRDIVKKCAGVSLAAETLGGLCCRSNKQMWKSVRDSYIWKLPEEQNGILRALKISYHYLPFYLKLCFAYCSLFPKGYRIQKDTLIQLWIAQELIYSFEGRSLDDIGNECVEELMKISFFQESEVDYCGKVIEFKMHDLVHDLAQSISGVECFIVCKDKEENYHEGVRHLFFNIKVARSPFETPSVIAKLSNIQTLIFAMNVDFSLDTICSILKFLRVLQFRNDEMDELPESIDRLKHLRYLQIQCPKLKKLPESVTNLQNLEVLKLECVRLEELPTRIQNMISLRCIILIPRIDLAHMPHGLEELQSLERLSHFVVSKDNVGCALNGLNGLTNLGGDLEIRKLERVKNAEAISETILKNKKNMSELKLVWNGSFEGTTDFKVLEKLEPHPNLKKLEIKGYGNVRFPRWMREGWLSLRNVVRITIEGCRNCQGLPGFSRLPSLKLLILVEMDGLEYVEDRPLLLQSGKECFSSLTKLVIENCPNLESWFPAVEAHSQQQQQLISFPSLLELTIYDCPKLKSVPHLVPSSGIKELWLNGTTGDLVHSVGVSNPTNSSSLFTSLESLSIEGCEGTESWPNWLVGSHLPSLRWLKVGCTPSLPFLPQQIQHLPALATLNISNYSEEALPQWMASSSLRSLYLGDCPKLKILPEWVLRDNTTVTRLQIRVCPHLFDRYNKDTGEDRRKIAHIRNRF